MKASDLRLAMPKTLLADCTDAPPVGAALASLACAAPGNSAITYQVSMYPDTSDVVAAFHTLLAAQGIQTNTNGCTKRNWNGERPWTHPTGSLGGHVACYLDSNGDSVLMWTHMSKNQKGVAPQDDHRESWASPASTPSFPASCCRSGSSGAAERHRQHHRQVPELRRGYPVVVARPAMRSIWPNIAAVCGRWAGSCESAVAIAQSRSSDEALVRERHDCASAASS